MQNAYLNMGEITGSNVVVLNGSVLDEGQWPKRCISNKLSVSFASIYKMYIRPHLVIKIIYLCYLLNHSLTVYSENDAEQQQSSVKYLYMQEALSACSSLYLSTQTIGIQ